MLKINNNLVMMQKKINLLAIVLKIITCNKFMLINAIKKKTFIRRNKEKVYFLKFYLAVTVRSNQKKENKRVL